MQLSGYALATMSIGTVDASRMFESLFQRYIFTCGPFVAHLPNVYPERLKSDTFQTFRCCRRFRVETYKKRKFRAMKAQINI